MCTALKNVQQHCRSLHSTEKVQQHKDNHSSTEKVQQQKDNPRQSAFFLGKRRTPAPKPGKQHKANPQPSPAEAPLIVTGTERTETRASFRGSVDWSRKPGLQERFVRTDDHIYSVHMAWYMGGDLVALPLTAQARGELCRGQLWIEANPCFRVICHRYIYIYIYRYIYIYLFIYLFIYLYFYFYLYLYQKLHQISWKTRSSCSELHILSPAPPLETRISTSHSETRSQRSTPGKTRSGCSSKHHRQQHSTAL